MGKGDRRAASRKRERAEARKREAALAGVPPLAETPRREKDRRPARVDKPDREAACVALNARARHMGWGDAKRAKAQSLEGQVGRALHLACPPEEIERLWPVWAGLHRAELAYDQRILGVSLYPQAARLAYLPERVEADPHHTTDTRDAATKDRDAVNAWLRWRDHLRDLTVAEAAALLDAVADRHELVRDAALTGAGACVVAALRRLADVVERDSARRPC